MGLFKETNYGKLISEKLSDFLKEHTSTQERIEIHLSNKVSLSTINYVIARTNNLSEASSKAIIKLVEIAVINCADSVKKNKQAGIYFKSKLESK